jgi:hypothetical protein
MRIGFQILSFLILLVPFFGFANSNQGVIHTLHVNLASNKAHIYLEGMPVFDGGGCSMLWTGNSMDDEKFRTFVWPLLMTAYAMQKEVTVTVEGCDGSHPKIVWVDLTPRE